MRIRKHARNLGASLGPDTDVQTHYCQLNQNPWDVNGVDGFEGCGGLDYYVSVVDREIENKGYIVYSLKYSTLNFNDTVDRNEKEVPERKNEQCAKTDGKRWRCQRVAVDDSTLCEHHLSLSKNHQNSAQDTIKDFKEKLTTKQHNTRKKRTPTFKPDDFYYYSNSRPRRGKKKGETSKNKGIKLKKKSDSESEPTEDDDEDYEVESKGKKRARKPIKARSVKSLM